MNTLEQRIEFLEKRVAQLEQRQQMSNPWQPGVIPQPFMPQPTPDWQPLKLTCPKCNTELKNMTGYVCPNSDCPCQLKVTC